MTFVCVSGIKNKFLAHLMSHHINFSFNTLCNKFYFFAEPSESKPHTSWQTLFYITTVSLVHLNNNNKNASNYNPIISNIWYILKIPQLLPKYLNSLYFPRDFVVVQLLWLFVTSWTATWQASLSFIISWSLFKLTPEFNVLI